MQDDLVPLDVPVLFPRFPRFSAYVFVDPAAPHSSSDRVESGIDCAILTLRNVIQQHFDQPLLPMRT